MGGKTVSRKRMIDEMVGLEPIAGSEYERGQSELIARCFLQEDTADEAMDIRTIVRERLLQERRTRG